MRKGTRIQAYEYCIKEDTRIRGPYVKGDFHKKSDKGKRSDIDSFINDIKSGKPFDELIITHYKYFMRYNKAFHEYFERFKPRYNPEINIQLYLWEKELYLTFKSEPAHRRIFWIWSDISGTGKTIFKQFCQSKFDILDINNFVFRDIIHNYNSEMIIWANISRTDNIDDNKLHVLEKLSDQGYCQSTKYEGSKKYIRAHIVVTSNHEPPLDMLPERIISYNVAKEGDFIYRNDTVRESDEVIEEQ